MEKRNVLYKCEWVCACLVSYGGDSGNVCFTSGALPRLAERAEDHVWACLCLCLPLLQHHALSWHRHGVTQAFPPISQSFQSFIQKQTPVFETEAKNCRSRFCPDYSVNGDKSLVSFADQTNKSPSLRGCGNPEVQNRKGPESSLNLTQ